MSKITIIEGNSDDKDTIRNFMVKGEKGADGVSPTVSVEREDNEVFIDITDAAGTKSAVIEDGISPIITTSKTGGVTTVSFEDAEGTKTATINDGETYEVPTNGVIGWDSENTIPSGYEEVNNPNDYSTNETVYGKWIDGKPLYQKTISFGALPNTDIKSVAHNIQNLKRIVDLSGFAGSSINKGGITLPHATSYPIALFADDTNVHVLTTNDATAYTETYIYLKYTKTTD